MLFYLPKIKKGSEKQRDTIYLVFVFILLGVVHIFKNTHSIPDVDLYIDGFKEISQNKVRELLTDNLYTLKAEKGYILLNKLILLFTKSPMGLILVTSVIILCGYFFSIRKYSPIVFLSVFLYLMGPYAQSIYVLRQHMAMSILLFTYPYIINRQLLKYLIVVLLAFSIHQSAFIFLPVYFIYEIKNIKTVFILGCLFIVMVVSRMEVIIEYFIQNMFMDYVSYLQDDTTNWKNFALLFSVLFIRLIVLKKDFVKEGIDRLLSIMILLGVAVSYLGMGFPGIGRLNLYFSECLFLVLPNTVSHIKNKVMAISITTAYIIFLLAFFIKHVQTGEIRSLTLSF